MPVLDFEAERKLRSPQKPDPCEEIALALQSASAEMNRVINEAAKIGLITQIEVMHRHCLVLGPIPVVIPKMMNRQCRIDD